MSHPINLDLDEIGEDILIKVIAHRQRLQSQGRCDFCGGYLDDSVCKMKERHNKANYAPRFIREKLTNNGVVYHPCSGLLQVKCLFQEHDLQWSGRIDEKTGEFSCVSCSNKDTIWRYLVKYKYQQWKKNREGLKLPKDLQDRCNPPQYEIPKQLTPTLGCTTQYLIQYFPGVSKAGSEEYRPNSEIAEEIVNALEEGRSVVIPFTFEVFQKINGIFVRINPIKGDSETMEGKQNAT